MTFKKVLNLPVNFRMKTSVIKQLKKAIQQLFRAHNYSTDTCETSEKIMSNASRNFKRIDFGKYFTKKRLSNLLWLNKIVRLLIKKCVAENKF